mmetsp:Transcript_24319/g.65962  ORF Transcript_24319/g.65962 Transcript_24319/m.65962 type:complete len:214 (+) Transcript_24319:470-1111(+)
MASGAFSEERGLELHVVVDHVVLVHVERNGFAALLVVFHALLLLAGVGLGLVDIHTHGRSCLLLQHPLRRVRHGQGNEGLAREHEVFEHNGAHEDPELVARRVGPRGGEVGPVRLAREVEDEAVSEHGQRGDELEESEDRANVLRAQVLWPAAEQRYLGRVGALLEDVGEVAHHRAEWEGNRKHGHKAELDDHLEVFLVCTAKRGPVSLSGHL